MDMHSSRSERNVKKESVFQRVQHSVFTIITSVIFFSELTSSKPLTQSVCSSQECITAASNFEMWMDMSVDPCDDFYQYACGHYKGKYQALWDSTSEVMCSKISNDVKDFLLKRNSADEPTAVHKARKLFFMCINSDISKEKLKYLKISSLTSDDHFHLDQFFTFGLKTKLCVNLVGSKFYLPISYMYAQEKYRKARTEVIKMLKYMRGTFAKIIEQVTWMESQTKKRALRKLDLLGIYIPYPDINDLPELFEILDELYHNIYIDEKDNPLEIMSALQEILDSHEKNAIRKHFNDPLKKVNVLASISTFGRCACTSFYIPNINFISISPNQMVLPRFGNGLKALDYGGIGNTIGHEMMHSFGPKRNEWGITENWWSEISSKNYDTKMKCYVTNEEITKNKNIKPTVSTIEEDFADRGGFNLALLAYRNFVSETGVEPLLVHFENFTHEQLFTLEYANAYCNYPQSNAHNRYDADPHSPDETRVNEVFRNSKDFAKIWNCPRNSGMNPSVKCSFW